MQSADMRTRKNGIEISALKIIAQSHKEFVVAGALDYFPGKLIPGFYCAGEK